MRANRIGWLLVAFFFAGGAALTAVAPDIWLGWMWMGGALALAAFYFLLKRRADRAERLIREGLRGEAEVLALEQTGMFFNANPRVRMRLRIRAPGVEPFEVERTYTVPVVALGALLPGRTLSVSLDREHPGRFAIDWLGAGEADGRASPLKRLRELTELRDAGLIDGDEFQRKRTEIVNSI